MPRLSGSGLRPRVSAAVLRAQTDGRLVALARGGNEQAFAAIFDRYTRELHAHAGRIVRTDRADDVVQQAMLKAWIAMSAEAEIGDLRAWLHQIVRNGALDQRAKRGYDDGEIPATTAGPLLTDVRAEAQITAAGILAAVAALSESQRRALTLTALEGLSGRETAREMGVSETAVRQLVHRARSSVRSAVSAVTPLPLVTWIAELGPEAAGRGAIGLGGSTGLSVAALKVVAVLGLGGTTVATVASSVQQSHQRDQPPIRAAGRARTVTVPNARRPNVRSVVAETGIPVPSRPAAYRTLHSDGRGHHHNGSGGAAKGRDFTGATGSSRGLSGEQDSRPREGKSVPSDGGTSEGQGRHSSEESVHPAVQEPGSDSHQQQSDRAKNESPALVEGSSSDSKSP